MKKSKAIKPEMPELSEHLSKAYSVSTWPQDPESKAGKQYFKTTVGYMKTALKQAWMDKLISRKKNIRILEICGGVGFGGIALSKLFLDKGLSVRLLISDLRRESLDVAQGWGEKTLGKKPDVCIADARDLSKLKGTYDICLMYGLSTTHFTPWDMVRLLASVSGVLSDNGLLLVDEFDRRYTSFVTLGYKWALAAPYTEDELVVSFHTGYSVNKGTCRRAYVNFSNPTTQVPFDFFFWSPAELGALLWTFFHDVDMVRIARLRRFVVGYKPRGALKLQDLKAPSLLKGIFNE